MTKKKVASKEPKYRMLALEWLSELSSSNMSPKFDQDNPYGSLGSIRVIIERSSCAVMTRSIELMVENGWRLQQVVIPDPVRHPQVVYGLFVKEGQ